MDNLNLRALCRQIAHQLREEAATDGLHTLLVDEENGDNFVIFLDDWQGEKRLYGPFLHLEVRDDKIWIHFDGTHEGVGQQLLDAGVLPSQLVLAWQHPSRRALTRFAAA